MKKLLSIVLIALISASAMKAQVHLFLEENQVSLPDGLVSAWEFPVKGEVDAVFSDLKDYCKSRNDLKLKKGGDNIMIAEKVSLPAISSLRGDLLAYCQVAEQSYTMALIYKLGYDISVNSKSWASEMENLRSYSKSFLTYHYEQHYARVVKELEKQIKGLEKEKKQLDNKVENLSNKINNLGKKIGKETETEKINEIEAEINTLEADMRVITDQLPGLKGRISDLNEEVTRNKKASNAYLSTIASF